MLCYLNNLNNFRNKSDTALYIKNENVKNKVD